MSPRKLTENDKQEILEQYRNSQATTSTLAKSYEVSSSTISRFLKNKLSSTEYEDLIQQKRLARTPRGEKSAKKATDSTKKTKAKAKSTRKSKAKQQEADVIVEIDNDAVADTAPEVDEIAPEPDESKLTITTIPRRRRRRSNAASESVSTPTPKTETIIEAEETTTPSEPEPEPVPNRLVLDKKIADADELDLETDKPERAASQRLILKADRVETEPEDDEDNEDDGVDIITLKEMLGEDLEDFNEDDEDDEDDDWEEEELSYPGRTSSLSDVQILPLSQASFPRTCYLVIDRSAELIVKPLSEFADLGAIPQEENQQTTLPVFDNHRIAKRFSHRRERIIKVPDGRMLQKTSRHLQDKGITRLLIDGQIYSLIN